MISNYYLRIGLLVHMSVLYAILNAVNKYITMDTDIDTESSFNRLQFVIKNRTYIV